MHETSSGTLLMSSPASKWILLGGALLTLASLIGLAGGLGGAAFLTVWALHLAALVVAVVFGVHSLWKLARSAGHFGHACLALTFLSWLVSLILGFLPITARDALIHHLAVPKWWLIEGRIFSIPWHDWSYYPMLLQVGFTGLISLGHLELTPLYHLLYGILLACSVAELTRACSGTARTQLLAAATVALLPAVIKLEAIPLVDLGLALFSTLTLLGVVRWYHEGSLKVLIGAGLSLGFALSTKYNGLLFVASVLPFALIGAVQAKRSGAEIVKAILIIGIFALLANAPWLGRNYLITGNPLYPLYQSKLGPPSTVPPDPKAARGLTPLQTRLLLHGESLPELALLPVRIFVQGEDENPRLFDGRLSPFLLLAILPAFFIRQNPAVALLSGSSFLYFFLSLLMADARVRYLAPLFGSLAALSALGFLELERRLKPNWQQFLCAAAVLFQALWAIIYVQGLAAKSLATEYFSGALPREAYLEKTVPEYGIARYMNEHLPQASRTYLVLTGNRFFYFDTPVVSSGHASAGELLRWIRSSKVPDDIYSKLTERDITHLLLHAPRLSKLFETSLDQQELARWNLFREQHLTLVTSSQGAMLFSVHE